jgi:hypothetical protein
VARATFERAMPTRGPVATRARAVGGISSTTYVCLSDDGMPSVVGCEEVCSLPAGAAVSPSEDYGAMHNCLIELGRPQSVFWVHCRALGCPARSPPTPHPRHFSFRSAGGYRTRSARRVSYQSDAASGQTSHVADYLRLWQIANGYFA